MGGDLPVLVHGSAGTEWAWEVRFFWNLHHIRCEQSLLGPGASLPLCNTSIHCISSRIKESTCKYTWRIRAGDYSVFVLLQLFFLILRCIWIKLNWARLRGIHKIFWKKYKKTKNIFSLHKIVITLKCFQWRLSGVENILLWEAKTFLSRVTFCMFILWWKAFTFSLALNQDTHFYILK